MKRVDELVKQLRLQSHPEGGYYHETYRSQGILSASALPTQFGGSRNFSTAIYFLLDGNQFSAFHRIKSDEVWHFYEGCGLHIYVLREDGRGEILKLGNRLEEGFSFQQVVPAGAWFASRPADPTGYSLVGCTVSPGFDFADFEMAKRNELLSDYPHHEEWIEALALE